MVAVQAADIKLFADFAKSLTGPTDIAIFFDGRVKSNKYKPDAALLNRPRLLDIYLLFRGAAKTVRAGRTKQVIYSAPTVECGAVVLPCPATRFSIQPAGT